MISKPCTAFNCCSGFTVDRLVVDFHVLSYLWITTLLSQIHSTENHPIIGLEDTQSLSYATTTVPESQREIHVIARTQATSLTFEHSIPLSTPPHGLFSNMMTFLTRAALPLRSTITALQPIAGPSRFPVSPAQQFSTSSVMEKLKSHSGTKKRFRLTGGGLVSPPVLSWMTFG